MLYIGYAAAALIAWTILAFIVGILVSRCIHTDPPALEWTEPLEDDDLGVSRDISMTSRREGRG